MSQLPCPDCSTPLQALFIERGKGLADVRIDRCATCRGLWFEVGELEQAVAKLVPQERLGAPTDRRCPACTTSMETVLLPGAVPAETCTSCRGVWLDPGELQELGGKEPRRSSAQASAGVVAGAAVGAASRPARRGSSARSKAARRTAAPAADEAPQSPVQTAAFECAKCQQRTPFTDANGTASGLVCGRCTPQIQAAPQVPDVDLSGVTRRRYSSRSGGLDLGDLFSVFL